jgi:uncharacterized phage-associated protein
VGFPFNEKKATQAAAFLLKRHGRSLNYMLLIKLLYYADREALLRRGTPITGDQMVSMDYGPVLSNLLGLVRNPHRPSDAWRNHIETGANYIVRLREEIDTSELSRFELELLAAIDAKHGQKDPFELSGESHLLPEWVDPKGSSIPIQVEDLVKAEHGSDQDIADVEGLAKIEWFFRELEKD